MGTIIIVIIGIFIVIAVFMYNSLVRLKKILESAWAQIDVQLKRRYDLIPNLVETCKGYMKHEREVLENVTKARQQAIDVSGVKEQAKAENFLTQTLRSLFAVVENYPDLKANQNLLALQEELTSTENRVSFARQHYNDSVMNYNTRIAVFPSNIIANIFGFRPSDFFELAEGAPERQAPQVKFS
jgi:LemA protein